MKSLAVLLFTVTLAAEPVRIHETGFTAGLTGALPGRTVWTPGPEIAPARSWMWFYYRTRPASLAISGNGNSAAHGGWERALPGIDGGSWHRFSAYYRCTGVPHEPVQIVPQVDWRATNGKRAGDPALVYNTAREGEWTRVTGDFQAPERATSAVLQLYLANAPLSHWRRVSLSTSTRSRSYPGRGGSPVSTQSLSFVGRRPAPAE